MDTQSDSNFQPGPQFAAYGQRKDWWPGPRGE